tara:strand:- start:61 stop:558 length:498 start_codon:yes stop_codon:yes gene_type:complete
MNKQTKIETTSALTPIDSGIEPNVEKAVIEWGQGETKLIDVLREEGKVWTDFLSPKNAECTSDQAYYDGMKLVMARMLKQEALYLEDPKNNEPRNVLVRKCTSKLKDLRKLLKPKAEKAEPRTPAQMFIDYLEKADKLFEKDDQMFGEKTEDISIALTNVINQCR